MPLGWCRQPPFARIDVRVYPALTEGIASFTVHNGATVGQSVKTVAWESDGKVYTVHRLPISNTIYSGDPPQLSQTPIPLPQTKPLPLALPPAMVTEEKMAGLAGLPPSVRRP